MPKRPGNVSPLGPSFSLSMAQFRAEVTSAVEAWVIFSTPTTITASHMPLAIAIQACLKAMPPEAQAPSTLVQGMLPNPKRSPTMPAKTSLPVSGPLMKLPRYKAPMRSRSIPDSTMARAAASTANDSIGVAICLPKVVEPIPATKTSRMIIFL